MLTKTFAMAIAVCLSAYGWQKVNVKDLDDAVKKNAADIAKTDKSQSSEIKAASQKADNRAAQSAQETELDRYKQEERFQKLEQSLLEVSQDKARVDKKAEDDRVQAIKDAKDSHNDLMRSFRNAAIGIIATLTTGLVMMAVKFLGDKHHHQVEEYKLDSIASTSNHIKGLVNSTYTAALQGRLDANKITLTALLQVVASAKLHGEPQDPSSQPLIEETQKNIRELETTLADRLKAT